MQNSVNLSPGYVKEPFANQGISLCNTEVAATTTVAAVQVGDDYLTGLLAVACPYLTATSLRIQVYTSDVDSSIPSTGTLIYDSGVQTAAFSALVKLSNLVASVIPGSGPQPEPIINEWCQVVLTVVGGSEISTASVMLLV